MIEKKMKKIKKKTGWSRNEFRRRLKQETGLEVSARTISRWQNGKDVQKTYKKTVKKFLDDILDRI